MRICVSTANLGGIDATSMLHCPQTVPPSYTVDYAGYNDGNLAPRHNALHPRLQAKIPKMLAYELHPGYDYYVWIDGSILLHNAMSIAWLVEQCEGAEMALFRHPYRSSIKAEAEYCYAEMSAGNAYLVSRYADEPMLEQINAYLADPGFKDDRLFAGGVFIYSSAIVAQTHNLMSDWFYHCARHSVQDQLSLPYLLQRHAIQVNTIEGNLFDNPYFMVVGHR